MTTKLPFVKTPNGKLLNLNYVVRMDIREHLTHPQTEILWAFIADAEHDEEGSIKHIGWAVTMGDMEHCVSVKEEIEKILDQHGCLHVLDIPDEYLIEAEEEEEPDDDKEEEPTITPVPDWFRNLPADEGADWNWD